MIKSLALGLWLVFVASHYPQKDSDAPGSYIYGLRVKGLHLHLQGTEQTRAEKKTKAKETGPRSPIARLSLQKESFSGLS